MNSDTFWQLFAETGDIEFYLIYKESGSQQEEQERESA